MFQTGLDGGVKHFVTDHHANATDELRLQYNGGIELARNARLKLTPAVLKMAQQLRKQHGRDPYAPPVTAKEIAFEIKKRLGVAISAHYINTLLRRAAK